MQVPHTPLTDRPSSAGTPRRRRRAYILLVVLGMTVVVSTLGLDFAQTNATVMPESANRLGALRAQYAAESGVAIATRFLMCPPTTVLVTDYWRGANGLRIDASNDFVDVSVQRDAADATLYHIVARGTAVDPDGSIRGRRLVYVDAVEPPVQKWVFPYAFLGRSITNAPLNMFVYGNLHANGNVTSPALTGGWCNGRVSSTLTASWLGGGPPTEVISLAPALTLPTGAVASYANYTIKGRAFSAYFHDSNSLQAIDSATLNAIDMSATNPGRIIRTNTGDVNLRGNQSLTGCLLVDGKLILDGVNNIITAVPGFPALVVTGNIEAKNKDFSLTVNGPVICAARITSANYDNIRVTINGPVISAGTPGAGGTGTVLRFNQDPTRSVFWNLESAPDRQPITLVRWREQL